MEKAWLHNTIRNGTLKDNNEYLINANENNEIVFQNRHASFVLSERKKGGTTKTINNNDGVWSFLHGVASIFRRESLQLFTFNSHEYEHNTEDDLITVSGLTWNKGSIQTGNVVGSVKKGNHSLKITSRFGDDFLKYIISDADGFLELKDFGGTNKDNEIHWLLIYLWKIKLKKAFRLGLPKEYQTQNERLTKPRGSINTLDYFINKKLGKYKCTYREHSYLTDAALLINATFLSNKVKDFCDDLLPIAQSFRVAAQGEKLSLRNLEKVKPFKNPFYSDYNEVIELSKKILFNKGLDIGNAQDSTAFLFDVSMLFEYFIKKLLKRNGVNVLSKFNEALTIPTGKRKQELQPDLIIQHDSSYSIFDVKYKHFDQRYGVSREDLFQIHTYIGQYGNVREIKSCGFIYPSKYKREPLVSEMEVMGKKISFEVYFLEVPQLKEGEFYKAFSKNCQQLIKEFKKC